jgi:hypothetical protein
MHQQLFYGGESVDITSSTMNWTISNLDEDTTYVVYCSAVGVLGIQVGHEKMVNVTISTQCCREIAVTVYNSHFLNNSDQGEAVLFSTSRYAQEQDEKIYVDIIPDTMNDARAASPVALAARRLIISSDNEFMGYVHYRMAPPGEYCYTFSLTASQSAQYKLSVERYCFNVIEAVEEPSSPELESAEFSSDGTYIKAIFNTPTSIHGGIALNCYSFFIVKGIDDSSFCVSKSDRVVHIFLTSREGEELASVGNLLTLKGGMIKAKCTVSDCSSWSFASHSSVVIAEPKSRETPTISIWCPDTIAAYVDVHCEFVTTNDGGRPLENIGLSLQSVEANNSIVSSKWDLGTDYDSSRGLLNILTISNHSLQPGNTYSVQVSACSFLGACTRSSHIFVVSRYANHPVVSLRCTDTMYSSDALNAESKVHISTLGRGMKNIAYTWRIFMNGNLVPDNGANSSSLFYLPPHTLIPGMTYKLTVTAEDTLTGKSSTARRFIRIKRGNLIPIFNMQSFEVTLNRGELKVFNGSASYDQDMPDKTGTGAGLVFNLLCERYKPIPLEDSCDDLVTFCSGASCFVSVRERNASTIDYNVYRITILISHSQKSDIRKVRRVFIVQITPPTAPLVQSFSMTVGGDGRITGNNPIKLSASFLATEGGCATITGRNFDMTPAVRSEQPEICWPRPEDGLHLSQTLIVVLNLYLHRRSTYGFDLSTFSESEITSKNYIEVIPNVPPLGGRFIVDPNKGIEMKTRFILAASDFVDSDLPLTYIFTVCSPFGGDGGCKNINGIEKLSRRFDTLLASVGQDCTNNMNAVGVKVLDSWNAETEMFTDIQIEPNYNFTIEDMTFMVENAADEASILWTLTLAIDIWNRIECGNDHEMTADGQSTNSTAALAASDSCDSRCTRHGTCITRSRFGNECVADSNCRTQCVCNEGFGGRFCEVPLAELYAANRRFQLYLNRWGELIRTQAPQRSTVIMWLEGLAAVSHHDAYLVDSSKKLLVLLCLEVLYIADEIQVSNFDIIRTVEKILDLSLLQHEFGTSGTMQYLQLLKFYQEKFVFQKFQVGQYPEIIESSTFRIYVTSFPETFGTVTISPWSGLTFSFWHEQAGRLVVAESDALKANLTQVSAIDLVLDAHSVCKDMDESCFMNVTIRNDIADDLKQTHTTRCTKGVPHTKTYECPSGVDLVVSCNGTVSGYIKSNCSFYRQSRVCKNLFENGECTVIDSNANDTVCQCYMPAPTSGFRTLRVASVNAVTLHKENSEFIVNDQIDEPDTGLPLWVIAAAFTIMLAATLAIVLWTQRCLPADGGGVSSYYLR